MAEFTRDGILRGFEELLETTPFDKITVSGIIEKCGVSRNTFYYHFRDVYDLLDAWLLSQEERYLRSAANYGSWQDVLKAMVRDAEANKPVIRHIFEGVSRQRLEQYVFETTDESLCRIVRREAGDLRLAESDVRYITDFYQYACLGFFLRYLWGGMSADADAGIDRLSVLFDGTIRSAAENAVRNPPSPQP